MVGVRGREVSKRRESRHNEMQPRLVNIMEGSSAEPGGTPCQVTPIPCYIPFIGDECALDGTVLTGKFGPEQVPRDVGVQREQSRGKEKR